MSTICILLFQLLTSMWVDNKSFHIHIYVPTISKTSLYYRMFSNTDFNTITFPFTLIFFFISLLLFHFTLIFSFNIYFFHLTLSVAVVITIHRNYAMHLSIVQFSLHIETLYSLFPKNKHISQTFTYSNFSIHSKIIRNAVKIILFNDII